MQHSPSEIKEKLLQALDRDNNVVDMALAMEVISLLEKTTVTKEALETTRIGRLVNEMRKKTKNESLARRAKDLVRRWRDMVAKPTENGTGGTGQGPGAIPTNHIRLSGMKTSVSSPALRGLGKITSPAQIMRSSSVIPPTSPAFRGVSLSPAMRKTIHPSNVISPSNSVASNVSTSPGLSFTLSQTHSNSSRPSTPSSLVAKSKAISPGPGRPFESISLHNSSYDTGFRGVKRGRDDEETMTGFESSEKRSKPNNGVEWSYYDECSRESALSWSGDSHRLNASSNPPSLDERSSSKKPRFRSKKADGKVDSADVLKEKFASITRVSKVKTTQELLEDLARRSGSPTITTKAETLTSQQPSPAAPLAGSTASVNRNWQDAKQEIMAKFLESQENPDSSREVVDRTRKPLDAVEEILAKLPPIDPAAIRWDEEEEEEQQVQQQAAKIPPKQVTEEDIDRLHSAPVENVNGSRDYQNEFREWHETMSVSSYHGDLLHLLPYVVIE